MSKEKQIDLITDLLIDFDEMGFSPTTTVPDPDAYAIKWRDQLTKALQEYFKQSEVEWIETDYKTVEHGFVERRGKAWKCTNCLHVSKGNLTLI